MPTEDPFVGNCTKCHSPLHFRAHWLNFMMHKDCFDEELAKVRLTVDEAAGEAKDTLK